MEKPNRLAQCLDCCRVGHQDTFVIYAAKRGAALAASLHGPVKPVGSLRGLRFLLPLGCELAVSPGHVSFARV